MLGRKPDIGPRLGTKIKQQIVLAGPEGITQSALCDKLAIPRMTANRYCNKFEQYGEIRVVRQGRYARYIAKSKILMDPEIGAYAQGREAYYKILRKGPPVLFNPERFEVDVSRLTDLELAVLYFSNIMGALLVYVMMQAMSQGNPILRKEYNRKGLYYLSSIRKDRLVRQWIDGFVSAILASAPLKLKKLVYQKAGSYPATFKDRVALLRHTPSLSINEPELAKQAAEAFANIYPSIYKTLDNISERLPETVKYEKNSLDAFEKSSSLGLYGDLLEENERMKQERKSKQIHNHEYKLMKVKAGIKYYECEICHRKKSV